MYPHCAFNAKDVLEMGAMLEYSLIWNALYYPAGCVPVTTVEKDEEQFSDKHNDRWTKFIDRTAKGSAGMPISVQVIAHNYEDEKVLAVMKAIEKGVKYDMKVPNV